MGAAQSGLFAVTVKVLADWFPQTRRGTASAVITGSMSIGAVVASGLTVRLLGPLGWRATFDLYAWIGILKKEGLLNQFLMWLHIIDQPLTILNTNWAVYIGIIYSYMPFMILPLYAALERLDNTLLEAASDLGSPPLRSFWQITFPLSLPGVVAGCFLVFIPVTGEFVIPDLLGGHGTLMIGKTLWDEFFANRDWPLASAVAVVLLILLVVPIVIFQNQEQKRAEKES